MSKYWKSPRTGQWYDVTDGDRHGNFRPVSSTEVHAPAYVEGAAVAGVAATSTAVTMAIVALLPFMILIALSGWPLIGFALLALSIGMLWVPAGRTMRPWIWTAIALSVLYLPLSMLSMYMSGWSDSGGYFALGALPLVPVAALICAIVAAVKRLWRSAVLSCGIAAGAGVMSLATLVEVFVIPSTDAGPTPKDLTYDNISGIVCFLILGVCWTAIMRHKATR